MATVYKAMDKRLKREVAFKIIRLENFAPAALAGVCKRFDREAHTLARMAHRNIVSIIDYGEHEGAPYLVMPYLNGGTLKSYIGHPLPLAEAARLLAPIARALNYAHGKGILHRDVKPANILITEAGMPMLSDFGVAKLLEDHESETLTGINAGIGTPEYMAPEQWEGKARAQSDQYALGVVFFELLSGRKPFAADTPAAVMVQHITARLPSLCDLVPGLPPEVDQVISRVLAKRWQDRYPNMAEFVAVLEGLASGKIVMLSPVKKQSLPPDDEHTFDVLGTVPKRSRRTLPAWIIWLAGLLGLGVVALGGVLALKPGGFSSGSLPTMAPTPIQALLVNILPTQTAFFNPSPTPASAPTSTLFPTLIPTTLGIGSKQISQKDGMELLYIPEGSFLMGASASDGQAYASERPQHNVWLDAFWMDRTEVSNAQYAACVTASACSAPAKGSLQHASKVYGQSDLYYGNAQYNQYPVDFVDWAQADAYCKWAGRQLPTEAQWEKAARGTDGRTYPWGEEAACDKANYTPLAKSTCLGDTSKVGSYPNGASPFGALDMAGNVAEWVADWYEETFYQNSPQRNPTGPVTGQYRILRGGSYHDFIQGLRSSRRQWADPSTQAFMSGFRCAAKANSTK
jgi:serine/threonine-protein kinase